jgi:hypothetical protein
MKDVDVDDGDGDGDGDDNDSILQIADEFLLVMMADQWSLSPGSDFY